MPRLNEANRTYPRQFKVQKQDERVPNWDIRAGEPPGRVNWAQMAEPAEAGAAGLPDEAAPLTRADAVASRERILDAAAALAGDRRLEHDRDRRRRRRRALDALPPLPEPRRRSSARSSERARAPATSAPARGDHAAVPAARAARPRPAAARSRSRTSSTRCRLTSSPTSSSPRRGARPASRSPSTSSTSTARSSSAWRAPRTSPPTLEAPPALGPEIVPEGLPGFQAPPARAAPRLRGRAAVAARPRDRPAALHRHAVASLDDIAKQGAAALELANDYTDFDRGRAPAQADHAGRRDPAEPLPAAHRAHRRRAARGRPAPHLRGRRRLVRLRREPRRRLAGDRRRRRQRPDRRRPGRRRARRPARRAPQRRGPRAGGRWRCTRPSARSATPTSTSPRSSPAGAPPPRPSPGSTAATRTPYLVDADGNLTTLDGPEHPALGHGCETPDRSPPTSVSCARASG